MSVLPIIFIHYPIRLWEFKGEFLGFSLTKPFFKHILSFLFVLFCFSLCLLFLVILFVCLVVVTMGLLDNL